jgi:hypothetical protein
MLVVVVSSFLLSELVEAFESQLSLSDSPPRCRPVYSRKGLEHKATLQQHLFPGTKKQPVFTLGKREIN